MLGIACLALLPACAAEPPPVAARQPAYLTGPATGEIPHAAWRDLDAAVRASLPELGLAVLHTTSPTPRSRRYELIGLRDEPGVLTADFPEADPATPAFTARIGRFGDPEREQALLSALRDWRPRYDR